MRKKGIKLSKFDKRFVSSEILRAMDYASRKNFPRGLKIVDVYKYLKKQGWNISYATVRKLVKENIRGTGYKLYKR